MKRLIEFYPDGQGAPIYRSAPCPTNFLRVGLLWNWRACWVGVHHSKEAKRTCVNLVPFLTIWYTRPGGMLP